MPFHTPGFDWTAEAVDQCCIEWRSGRSAKDIGHDLGCNKNAVIGKMQRLKIRWGGHNGDVERHVRPRRQQNGEAKADRTHPFKPGKLLDGVAGPAHIARRKTRKRFFDLGPADCRWPCWDDNQKDKFFCGAPKLDGYSYCLSHCRASYVPTSRLTRATRKGDISATVV